MRGERKPESDCQVLVPRNGTIVAWVLRQIATGTEQQKVKLKFREGGCVSLQYPTSLWSAFILVLWQRFWHQIILHMCQFCRCPWSEFIDPVFEVLSERYTAARFLLVDADKCKVWQLLVLLHSHVFVAVPDGN